MPETHTPTRTPTKTVPEVVPDPMRRYEPSPDHCPLQVTRTTRRIRRTIGE